MMIKRLLKKGLIRVLNLISSSSEKFGTPRGCENTKEWCVANNQTYIKVYDSKKIINPSPVVLEDDIHILFRKEKEVEQAEAFVAVIENARVWGRNGAVITPDDKLLYDVSREFGKYGGVYGKDHSIFRQIKLASCSFIDGTVAVISSPGANNFHHWLYDNVARINLIEKANLKLHIDYFILDNMKLPFQEETLKKIGISSDRILDCHDNWHFHIKARKLVVPSLPSRLGIVSDWVPDFLNSIFSLQIPSLKRGLRIFLSRKKAPTRRVVNADELRSYLKGMGFIEYIAEDYSVQDTAGIFSNCEFIIGVHGSGFANLAFAPKGIKVIDIVSGNHIDPYYWTIVNHKKGKYAYLFGEGYINLKQADLITQKVDRDITVDLNKLGKLINQLEGGCIEH
ncbi:MAG: glycosyltransferase family 61 protein [Bacteroidetes bacterium]|nr:glycosyltransferase family 61 protein [Bacteroidota bacterium]